MNLGDMIALALALVIFGGSSGTFCYVATRLILSRLSEWGWFVEKAQ